MRRPPPRARPPILGEAATGALTRLIELVLFIALVAAVAYAAFSLAVGPEVRAVLVWLLGVLRRGLGFASAAYRWVVEQLGRLP